MTPHQLTTVKIGDNVTLRESRGRVTQTTARWFMVMWEGGYPEVIRREASALASRLHLEVATAPKSPLSSRATLGDFVA